MSLRKKVKAMAGGGITLSSGPVWIDDPWGTAQSARSQSEREVMQLRDIEHAQNPPPTPNYMVTASSSRSITVGAGQTMMVNVGGQPIQNVVQVMGAGSGYAGAGGAGGSGSYTGGAGGSGLISSASATAVSYSGGGGGFTSTASWAPAIKPLYDPQWFRDYLAARDEAVMERLSGD